MSTVDVYGGGAPLRDARRASRAISKYQAEGQIRVAGVDTDTDVVLAKVDALTQATGSGMAAVVRVSQAQTQLEQLAPQASGRLNLLADEHVLSVSEVLAGLRRDLRRR